MTHQQLINLHRDELERVALNYARATLMNCYVESLGDGRTELRRLDQSRAKDFADMFRRNMENAALDLLRAMTEAPMPDRTP